MPTLPASQSAIATSASTLSQQLLDALFKLEERGVGVQKLVDCVDQQVKSAPWQDLSETSSYGFSQALANLLNPPLPKNIRLALRLKTQSTQLSRTQAPHLDADVTTRMEQAWNDLFLPRPDPAAPAKWGWTGKMLPPKAAALAQACAAAAKEYELQGKWDFAMGQHERGRFLQRQLQLFANPAAKTAEQDAQLRACAMAAIRGSTQDDAVKFLSKVARAYMQRPASAQGLTGAQRAELVGELSAFAIQQLQDAKHTDLKPGELRALRVQAAHLWNGARHLDDGTCLDTKQRERLQWREKEVKTLWREAAQITELPDDAAPKALVARPGTVGTPIADTHLPVAMHNPEVPKELRELTARLWHKKTHPNMPIVRNWLMVGPHGSGKTYLATSIAKSAGVPIFVQSCQGLLASTFGKSAETLGALYERAAEVDGPVIVFLDELDAIGTKRAGQTDGAAATENARITIKLMDMLDPKPDSKYKNIITLAATNCPALLEDALADGRFQQRVSMPLPGPRQVRAFLQHSAAIYQVGVSGAVLDQAAQLALGLDGRALDAAAMEAAQAQTTSDIMTALSRAQGQGPIPDLAHVEKSDATRLLTGLANRQVRLHQDHAQVNSDAFESVAELTWSEFSELRDAANVRPLVHAFRADNRAFVLQLSQDEIQVHAPAGFGSYSSLEIALTNPAMTSEALVLSELGGTSLAVPLQHEAASALRAAMQGSTQFIERGTLSLEIKLLK